MKKQYLKIDTKEQFHNEIQKIVNGFSPEGQKRYEQLKKHTKLAKESYEMDCKSGKFTVTELKERKKGYDAVYNNQYQFEADTGIWWLGLCYYRTQCMKVNFKEMPK